MQPYDVFVLILLVLMTIFGGVKGMAWQIAQFASFAVSWKVAVELSPQLAPVITAEKPWDRIIAMLIIFVATSLLVWVLFRFVSKLIERVQLKEFDRQMGAILGLLNGLVIVMIVTFFGVMLTERSRDLILASHCGHYSARMIQRATPLLPEELRASLQGSLDKFNEEIANNAGQGGDTPSSPFSGLVEPTSDSNDDSPPTSPPPASPSNSQPTPPSSNQPSNNDGPLPTSIWGE